MKKIILIIICFIIGFLIYQKEDVIIIPSDAIRIRIIANSNNIKDLYEKEKLKESLEEEIYDFIKNSQNVMEAREDIRNNLDEIKKIISNRTQDFTINYGKNYFPRKIYKGIIYQEGEYESLVITLGKGLGDNWWCVLYPPLCLLKESDNTNDVEYRSLVYDVINNLT